MNAYKSDWSQVLTKLIPPLSFSSALSLGYYIVASCFSYHTDSYVKLLSGKYINGTTVPVDGGLWLSRPRHLPKEAVKQLSRAVERRSRDAPVGLPTSKL